MNNALQRAFVLAACITLLGAVIIGCDYKSKVAHLMVEWRDAGSIHRRSRTRPNLNQRNIEGLLFRTNNDAYVVHRPTRSNAPELQVARDIKDLFRANMSNDAYVVDSDLLLSTAVCWNGTSFERMYAAGEHWNYCVEGRPRVRDVAGASMLVITYPPTARGSLEVYLPTNTNIAHVEASVHRYCTMPKGRTAKVPRVFDWHPGLWFVTNEYHGGNIGHFMRDMQGLANLMVAQPYDAPPVAGLLNVDHAPWQDWAQWPRAMMRDVLGGQWGLNEIRDINGPNGAHDAQCFEAVAQKHSFHAITPRGRDALRSAALMACNLTDATPLTSVVLVNRTYTRRWGNFEELVTSLRRFAVERSLRFRLQTLSLLSFCEQVELMGTASVIVGPHGSEIGGNLQFMHPLTIVAEVHRNAHCAGQCAIARLQGQPYLFVQRSTENTTDNCKFENWLTNPHCLLRVDARRLLHALQWAENATRQGAVMEET